MKLKTDENGNVVVINDKPVYTDDEGKDIEVDVPSLFTKVKELNSESATHRRKANEVKETLEAFQSKFSGIEDLDEWLEQAKEAVDTVKNLKGKDIASAEKLKQIREEVNAAWEDKQKALKESLANQLSDKDKVILSKDDTIRGLTVSNLFASSPYFSGSDRKTHLLPDVAESYFGKHFKVEEVDGKLTVAGYINGNRILSRANPGEPADFNESIAEIIDKHPQKVDLFRSGKLGSGAGGNTGGDGEDGDLSVLRKQYVEAQKSNDVTTMVSLRTKIHALEMDK